MRLLFESAEDNSSVLGYLVGTFMELSDIKTQGSRNRGGYTRSLAKKRIIDDPNTKELLENRMLLGEPIHPENRFEISMKEASHCCIEHHINEEKNCIEGKLAILDTPNGRIIKTLMDFGAEIGVSARARGTTHRQGNRNVIDENSYVFKTWDLVTLPGFKNARLNVLNESVTDSVSDVVLNIIQECDKESLVSTKLLLESVDENIFRDPIQYIDNKLNEGQSCDSSSEDMELYERLANLELDLLEATLSLREEECKHLDYIECKNKLAKAENLLESASNDTEILKVKEENKKLRQSIPNLVNSIKELNDKISDKSNQLDLLEQCIEERDTMIRELKESLETALEEISSLNERLEDSQAKLSKLDESADNETSDEPKVTIVNLKVINESLESKAEEVPTLNLIKRTRRK